MSRPSSRIANLDGLRAISIVLVFLFHAQVPGFGGGFLGVSLFFTLSGYLLGLRLADQPLHRGSIKRYWVGRVRRLLPLAWLVLAGVVAVEMATNTAVTDAPRRLWMTAIGVANWNQLLSGGDYASLFASPDALVHYWSLAIEQQVYVVLPLILWVVWRLGTYPRRIAAIAGLAVLSWVLPVVTGWSVARTYYGTDTRSGEILIGVALALTHQWHRQQVTREADLPRQRANVLAAIAMVLMLALVFVSTPGGDFIRRGLLPLQSLLSVVLVHVAVRRRDLWRGVLESRSFVYIGTLSYAIYLIHWPLIVLVEQHDWPRPLSVLVVAAVTVAMSDLLTTFVETPFRRKASDRQLLGFAATAVLMIPVVITALPGNPTSAYLEQLERDGAALEVAAADGDAISPATSSPATSSPATSSPATSSTITTESVPATSSSGGSSVPSNPTTVPVSVSVVETTPPTTAAAVDSSTSIAFFGDSIALSLALAASRHPIPDTQLASGATVLGCSILPVPAEDRCASALPQWNDATATADVEVAFVISCQWELIEREVVGIGTATIGDPAFDAALAAAIRSAVQRLIDGGVERVAWLTCPAFSQTVGWPPEPFLQASRNPERAARMNDIIVATVAEFGDRAIVVDLAGWMTNYLEDASVRPDGSHFAYAEPTTFTVALGEILEPALGRS